MSCCANCEDPANKTCGSVVINFGDEDRVHPELVGSCFEAIDFFFRTARGDLSRDDLFIRVSNLGNTYNVSIFEKGLPFDTLVASLQFDPKTGATATKAYRTLTWTNFEFGFTFVPEKLPLWKKISNNVYRVRTYAGLVAVLEEHKIRPDDGFVGPLLKKAAAANHPSRWPVLLVLNKSLPILIRHADALCIPEWRNDRAWL